MLQSHNMKGLVSGCRGDAKEKLQEFMRILFLQYAPLCPSLDVKLVFWGLNGGTSVYSRSVGSIVKRAMKRC